MWFFGGGVRIYVIVGIGGYKRVYVFGVWVFVVGVGEGFGFYSDFIVMFSFIFRGSYILMV